MTVPESTMRCSAFPAFLILTALFVGPVGCSGSGVSTTARTTTDTLGETGDASADADASASDDPSVDSDTPSDDSSTDPTDATDPTDPTDPTDATDPTDPTDPTAEGTDGNDTTPEPVTLQGVWLSEGENIAPLLVDLTGAMSITATFGDNTFTVVTIDDQGQEVQQVGVYVATPSEVGEIYDIVLEQTMPSVITVEGIYEVDNSTDPPTLRYEVVQTEPGVGAVPPTAEGGFGSTSFGADLTQIYVRQ
jgi:hypothetical protein